MVLVRRSYFTFYLGSIAAFVLLAGSEQGVAFALKECIQRVPQMPAVVGVEKLQGSQRIMDTHNTVVLISVLLSGDKDSHYTPGSIPRLGWLLSPVYQSLWKAIRVVQDLPWRPLFRCAV